MIAFLPIKPTYAYKILEGTKKFEFRKKRFNKNTDIVIIYASSPVKEIIGCFKIEKILKDNPYLIWEKCKYSAGIEYNLFLDYFKNSNDAIAIEIADIFKFENPIKPQDIWINFKIPQSFKYMQEDDLKGLINYEPDLYKWMHEFKYA